MLLTPYMFAAGVIIGILQIGAHALMRDRTYLTPIPRYAVGVALALIPYSIALAFDGRQDAIVGVWYVFGASGLATWLGYEIDRPVTTDADAARLAEYLIAEHDDADEPEPRD